MTSALRMGLGPLFFAVVFASPAAAGPHRPAGGAQDGFEGDFCLKLAPPDVLRPESLAATGRGREFGSVGLSGDAPSNDGLWDVVGGRPSLPLSRSGAFALVARFARTGLFSKVEARARTGGDKETPELDIALTGNPRVRSVQVRGLSEFRTEDVLDRLLEAPTSVEIEGSRRELRDAWSYECPAPLPPRGWLARVEEGEVRSGILWYGLRGSLERVLRYLRGRGYPLARLEGELTLDGQLLVVVDEGRVSDIEVRGVDSHIVREVEMELGIRRGDVISSGELYSALERVQRRWPFLRPDRRRRRAPPPPGVQVEERSSSGVRFRSELLDDEPKPPPGGSDAWEDADEPMPRHRMRLSRTAWYAFEGDTLVVYLRSERSLTAVQWVELLRHTPVTGFAPGLAATMTLFDPGDRAHLLLDGAVNLNTRRHGHDVPSGTYLERLNAQERVDWLFGPRIRVPALGIAELGGQLHTLTDTPDRWRISPLDSYLYSAIFNRADREYYRRSGFAAFITAHLFEELTLGAEYRRDRYAPLDVPSGVWSVFNKGYVRYGGAPVDEGEIGSAVFRLEYRSERVPLHRVGSMWRSSETSLVRSEEPWSIGVRSVNTVEIADRSLGGTFAFTKIVSDSLLTLETGRASTLTLRVRAAGGRDLPLQKQEGLGGWTALRGYDFKEFRGNASLLGTLQLEGRHFGAFLDVGSVRQDGTGWLDPKSSAGGLFCFAKKTSCAEAAWRLDGRGRLLPEFRILFSVPL